MSCSITFCLTPPDGGSFTEVRTRLVSSKHSLCSLTILGGGGQAHAQPHLIFSGESEYLNSHSSACMANVRNLRALPSTEINLRSLKYNFLNHSYICTYIHTYLHTRVCVCVYEHGCGMNMEVRGQCTGVLVFCFYHVVYRARTRIMRLGCKPLYSLNRLNFSLQEVSLQPSVVLGDTGGYRKLAK